MRRSHYLSSISGSDATGSEEVQFSYGPDRRRWKQIYTGPSGTETTYYVGNGNIPAPAQLEVVFNGSTNFRHYIYAGSEPVAVYSRTSAGAVTMSYFLGDHQGGISTISASSGATDINESFTAFGQRRNPGTWSGPPATSDLNTIAGLSRQGYTFHTWMGQSMGLSHMNGRVEDAILGRMMSPDPHMSDASSSQSYNRYSYVNSNPLTLRDPSGFIPLKCKSRAGTFCSASGSGLGLNGSSAVSGNLDWDGSDSLYGDNIDLGALTASLNGLANVFSNALDAAFGAASTAAAAQSQSGSFNDPNLFNPQTASQSLPEITVTGSLSTPPALLPLTPSLDFPSFDTTGYGGFTPRIAQNNFVRAAGALVATTTATGAILGSTYAYLELPEALAEFASWGGEAALLGSAGAFSDIGAMGMTGAMLGAEGGILVLPAFGAGYAVGSYISPWVNQNIIDPYVYPMLGLPRY